MRRRLLLLASFGLLAAITWLAYRPSLGHIARADHWYYLMQTMHQETLGDTLGRTYSYNRTLSHGDYGLFRPVLFALLAVEKALFGHDFAWWQRTGVFIHLGVVGLFFLLLLRVGRLCGGSDPASPPPWGRRIALACGLTFFFTLNLVNIEMVVWSHINAYMLFVGIELGVMLLVLDLLMREDLTGRQRVARLVGAWMLLLVGAFTYEIGQLFALVVAGALAWNGWHRAGPRRACLLGFCFASVLIVYQGVDLLDRHAHPQDNRGADYAQIVDHAFGMRTIHNTTRYVLYTIVQPLFPTGISYSPRQGWGHYSRLAFSEPRQGWGQMPWDSLLLASVASVVLLLARTGLALAVIRSMPMRHKVLPFLALPLGLFGLHLGVTVLGRLNPRPEVLASSTYYAYLPFLMALVGLFALWMAAPAGKWGRRIDLALLLPLGVLTLVGGTKIHQINVRVRDQVRPIRLQVQALQDLVRRHGGDEHFGIGLDRASEPALRVFFGMPLAMTLYPKLVNRDDPSHVLMVERGKPCVLTVEDYRRRFPDRELSPPVRIVRAESPCSVFVHRGRYYGINHWDGVFDPRRDDHFYLLSGATEAEVLAQVPARDARVAEDTRSGKFIPSHLPVKDLNVCCGEFDFFQAGNRYYAIPADEGPLQPARLLHERYSIWFVAFDLEELRGQIARSAHAARRDAD
jgi:hypothetical protein